MDHDDHRGQALDLVDVVSSPYTTGPPNRDLAGICISPPRTSPSASDHEQGGGNEPRIRRSPRRHLGGASGWSGAPRPEIVSWNPLQNNYPGFGQCMMLAEGLSSRHRKFRRLEPPVQQGLPLSLYGVRRRIAKPVEIAAGRAPRATRPNCGAGHESRPILAGQPRSMAKVENHGLSELATTTVGMRMLVERYRSRDLPGWW